MNGEDDKDLTFGSGGSSTKGESSSRLYGFWLLWASSSRRVEGGTTLLLDADGSGSLFGVERSVCLVFGAIVNQNKPPSRWAPDNEVVGRWARANKHNKYVGRFRQPNTETRGRLGV
jgi:hypothetical protein